MKQVQLHFHQTVDHKEHDFYQDVDLHIIPKKGDIFKYTKDHFFKFLSEEHQNQFTDQNNFGLGNYYVIDVEDCRNQEGHIDYIIYLAFKLNK